jgi:outer membrane lipoprotein-sorting protein
MKQPLVLAATLLTGMMLSSLLVGCGAHPMATALKPKARTTAGRPAAYGAPGTQAAAAPQAVGQLLAQVHQAQQATLGFTATVSTYDKGPTGVEQDEIAVAYKRPNTLRLNMIKATGQAQGATILWSGGDSLQIKIKLGFMPVTTSLTLDDARVKSKNGWTLKQTEVNAIFKVLFDAQAQMQILGQQPGADGRPLTMLQVHSTQSPPGADHEVIGIDPQSGLPASRMLYRGQELIYRLTIKNMRPGVPSASEMSL